MVKFFSAQVCKVDSLRDKPDTADLPRQRSAGAHGLASAGELLVEHRGENPPSNQNRQSPRWEPKCWTLLLQKGASRFFSQTLLILFNPPQFGVSRNLHKSWIIVRCRRSWSPVCLSSLCHICHTQWVYPTPMRHMTVLDCCLEDRLFTYCCSSCWVQASFKVKHVFVFRTFKKKK